MKRSVFALVLLALCGCTNHSIKPAQSTQSEAIPTTCETAIREIAQELDEESLELLRNTPKDELIQFHMTWGMGIRNSYGLWTEESKLRKSCADRAGLEDTHPDSASGIIMDGVWEYVRRKDI